MMEPTYTLWFTGRHGAGKSTIANKLAEILKKAKIPFVLLDGDELRKTISSDLGYSIEARNEHMRRVAHIAKYISDHGVLVIASVASPTEKSRAYARKVLGKMLLVYVKCSLAECARRDAKGHYKKAKKKEKNFENFMTSDYEEPKDADIVLDTEKDSVDESVKKLMGTLLENDAMRLKN